MDMKLLQLAMNNLNDEVERLRSRMLVMESEIDSLKNKSTNEQVIQTNITNSDELMDIKEVQSKLGICYNSLNKLVKQGLLKPVRINQRRIRFLRKSVYEYIHSL